MFTDSELDYLAGQRLGRIATVGGDGQPHVVRRHSVTTPSMTLSTWAACG